MSVTKIIQKGHSFVRSSFIKDRQTHKQTNTMFAFIYKIGLVMRAQTISGLITINLVSDNIYRGLAFKIILYNVIHPYVLCLCL